MSTSAVSWTTRFLSVFRGPTSLTPANASDVREGVGDLAGSIMWLKTRLHDLLIGAEQRIIGRSGDQLEVTGHGIASNAPVQVFATSGGSLPSPLAENTVYYLRDVDADHIELSATSGPGAAITLTTGISGDVWVQTVPDWITTVLVASADYGAGQLGDLIAWNSFPSETIVRTASPHVTLQGLGVDLPILTAVGNVIRWFIDPPHGCIFQNISVSIDPGGHASLPAVMPTVGLFKVDQGGTYTLVGSLGTDPSGSTGVYNPTHTFGITGLAATIDRESYSYMIQFTQESGADSSDGTVNGMVWRADITTRDKGAG